MSRADDEDDAGMADDAQLRAMRTVWLSMRDSDKEPSGRGMADLLAAARAQVAARPQPEPAWKRVFAGFAELLRRPPVLALATVVLVAGTAVLVHNHGGMTQDEAPVASPPPVAMTASTAPAGPAVGQGAETLPRAELGSTVPAPTPASPVVTAAPLAHVAAAEPPRRAPSPKPTATPAPGNGESTFGGRDAKPAMNAIATDSDGQLDDVESSIKGPPSPAPPPPPVKVVAKAPMAPSPDAQAPEEQGTSKLTNDQLLRECEAAAARGDCAAVRVLVGRLRAQDPAFYRSTVVRDGALSKCLPAAQN